MGYEYYGSTSKDELSIAHALAKILILTPRDTISDTLAQKTDSWSNWELDMEDISECFPNELIHIYNGEDNMDGYFYNGRCVTYCHKQERFRFEDLY